MKNRDKPAYPESLTTTPQGDVYGSSQMEASGLTKREAFAMAAMQGMLANQNMDFGITNEELYADWAIKQSDALLKALENE